MFKCNQCTFQGDYKQNFKRHERNMHGNNKNEMYNNNSAPNIASISPVPTTFVAAPPQLWRWSPQLWRPDILKIANYPLKTLENLFLFGN